MTPFRALFGFEAPSAVSDALATSTAPMEEPLERAALFTSSSIRDRINQAQQKAYEAAQRDARKAARGRTEFSPGEYVLVFHEAARKLDFVWTGPFLIDSKLTAVTYDNGIEVCSPVEYAFEARKATLCSIQCS